MTAKKERLNEELEKGEKSGFIENFDKEDFLNQIKEKIEVKLNGIVIHPVINMCDRVDNGGLMGNRSLTVLLTEMLCIC